MPELLALCLGDAPDKAFSIAVDEAATVSRLRSLLAGCTRHNPSDLNLFAVKEGANLALDDARIEAFLVAAKPPTEVFNPPSPGQKSSSASSVPLDPVLVQTHLPVTWLRDPTALISKSFFGTKGLALLVTLDSRVVAGNDSAPMGTLPPPAYNAADKRTFSDPVNGSTGAVPSGRLFGGESSSHDDEKLALKNEMYAQQGPGSAVGSSYMSTQGASSPYIQNSPNPYNQTSQNSYQPGIPYQQPGLPYQQPAPHTQNLYPPNSAAGSALPSPSQPNLNPPSASYGVKEVPRPEGRSRKFWIMVWVIIGATVAVLAAVGVAVAVVLNRKSNGGSSSLPSSVTGGASSSIASTGTATTTAPTARPTSQEAAGTVLQRYNLFETYALSPNPVSSETFFAPLDDARRSFREIYYSNGSVKQEFPSIHPTAIHGLAAYQDQVFSADQSAIISWNIITGSQTSTNQNFVSTSQRSTYRVRFGVATADGAVFTVNDFYTVPTNNTGVIVVVPVDGSGDVSVIGTFPGGTFPWSAALVTSDRLLVGTGSGLVVEYTRSSRGWTVSRSFKAHSGGVRVLVLAPKMGLFYTGGLDRTVCAWSLSDLAVEGTAASPQAASLATYSGFGDEIYMVSVSEDETEVTASGKSGIIQVFSGATPGSPPRITPRWTTNVGFEVWNIIHQASSNSWFIGGNTKNPVRLAN
ncbi:hypothetical protein HDU67_004892 [Dinochytrium kinnereticum]|nr:hypothetical protein HDU67_004892 [Dinochytrium kinnereticum]